MRDSVQPESQSHPLPEHSSPNQLSQYQLYCPKLPLAVYREVVAHLRQVTGVDAGLLPQQSHQFDYWQSQVGGLWIRYSASADASAQRRVEQILTYYGDRYGRWETV